MWRENQRHILIICALGQELQIVKSVLKGQIFQWIQFHYHVCGVGLEKSMISLTEFLSHSQLKFELVINVGLAWYAQFSHVVEWSPSIPLTRGMTIQCLRIIQWDAKKELCVPPQYVIPDMDIVPLTSRYRPVRERSQIIPFLIHDDIVAIDMEGYAIESVCDFFSIPRIFIKILYDEIGADNISDIDYDDMLIVMKQSLQDFPNDLRAVLYTS